MASGIVGFLYFSNTFQTVLLTSLSASRSWTFAIVCYPLPLYVTSMETVGSGAISSEQVEVIRREMLQSFSSSVLPDVIQEVTPLIRDTLMSEIMPNITRSFNGLSELTKILQL